MTFHKLDYETRGFVGLRKVKGCASGDEQEQLLTERVSIREHWNDPPVEFNKYDSEGNIVNRRKNPTCFESDRPGDEDGPDERGGHPDL